MGFRDLSVREVEGEPREEVLRARPATPSEQLAEHWQTLKSFLGGLGGFKDPEDTSTARSVGEISQLIPQMISLGALVGPAKDKALQNIQPLIRNMAKRIAPGRPVYANPTPKAMDVDPIPGERLFKEPVSRGRVRALTPQQEDLVQIGMSEASKVADRPNINTESDFRKLGTVVARNAMNRAQGETNYQANVPEATRQRMAQIRKFDEDWEKRFGTKPSANVVKIRLKLKEDTDEIERLRAGIKQERIYSIGNPGQAETGIDLAEGQGLEQGDSGLSLESAKQMFSGLTQRQQDIARKLYVEGKGVLETSRELGVTPKAIRNAREAIIARVQKMRQGAQNPVSTTPIAQENQDRTPPPISGGSDAPQDLASFLDQFHSPSEQVLKMRELLKSPAFEDAAVRLGRTGGVNYNNAGTLALDEVLGPEGIKSLNKKDMAYLYGQARLRANELLNKLPPPISGGGKEEGFRGIIADTNALYGGFNDPRTQLLNNYEGGPTLLARPRDPSDRAGGNVVRQAIPYPTPRPDWGPNDKQLIEPMTDVQKAINDAYWSRLRTQNPGAGFEAPPQEDAHWRLIYNSQDRNPSVPSMGSENIYMIDRGQPITGDQILKDILWGAIRRGPKNLFGDN